MVLVLFSGIVFSEEDDSRGNLSLTFENDIFAFTDRYYTNGVNLDWMIPVGSFKENKPSSILHFSLGQVIYTPADITSGQSQGDRPYAGITFLGAGWEQRFSSHANLFAAEIGVVGPDSYARETQEFIHWLFSMKTPRGWEDQLKTGPAVTLWGSHKRRIAAGNLSRSWSFEVLCHLGGSIGNALSGAAAGMEVRAGFNSKNTLGSFFIRPGGEGGTLIIEDYAHPSPGQTEDFGLQLFLLACGRGVLRNVFLDGPFQQYASPVEKQNFTGDFVLGVDLQWKKWHFRYAYVYKTRQFVSQPQGHIIGSLNFGYAW